MALRTLHVRIAKSVLRLMPAHPPAHPLAGRPDVEKAERARARGFHRSEMEFEDERANGFLDYFGGEVDAAGDVVLDLGCGYGGRLAALAGLARAAGVGLEVKEPMAAAALRFARREGARHLSFLVGVGEAIPLASGSVDVILSYDVLEHVHDPRACLAECYRVLRPGGRLLLVFPPYYHPTGSHLEGYVSRVPYANVLFPSSVLLAAVDEVLAERGDRFKPGPLRPGDKLYWLNGLTVRGFERIVAATGFRVRLLRLLPLFSRANRSYDAWRMRYYAWLFAPLSRVPLAREYFTHRIVAALEKPGRADADGARRRR